MDCELFPDKTNDGRYFCSECNRENKRCGRDQVFWNSEQKMWNDHVFNPVLQWCKDTLNPDNVLACSCNPGRKSVFQAEIISKKQINKLKKDKEVKYRFLPLVNPFIEYNN
jgi:hypothetical protein